MWLGREGVGVVIGKGRETCRKLGERERRE